MPKKTDWQENRSPQNRGATNVSSVLDPNRFQYEVANEIGVTGRISSQQADQWDSQTRARKRRGAGGGNNNQGT
ncbi:MAG TPA: hypothetical protein GXX40_05970 [Firmicutes bacterium]|nr:hypothetical protein [Bacillota bacterium]